VQSGPMGFAVYRGDRGSVLQNLGIFSLRWKRPAEYHESAFTLQSPMMKHTFGEISVF
jgi:hypothetical protein